MRFKTFTVTPADFESWAAHQADAARSAHAARRRRRPLRHAPARRRRSDGSARSREARCRADGRRRRSPRRGCRRAGADRSRRRDSSPSRASRCRRTRSRRRRSRPDLTFDDNLLATGDAANGAKLRDGSGGCLGCHAISGNPMMVGVDRSEPHARRARARRSPRDSTRTTRSTSRAGSRTRAAMKPGVDHADARRRRVRSVMQDDRRRRA